MKFRSTIFILIAVSALYACNKLTDVPAAKPPTTYLNVVNTTTDTINYYLNGTRQNINSSIYSGGNTGYLSVASGQQNYEFRRNGHTEVLFNKPLTLDIIKKDTTINDKKTTLYIPLNYTLFVCGTSADKSFLLRDTLTTSTTDARVKFVNSADGANAVDVTLNDSLYFKNQAFKTGSQLKAIGPGPKVIKVYPAGQSVVKATQTVTLSANEVYTLYVKGVPGGTGKSAFTVSILTNTL